ncbi:MAG: hypothetical protein HY924_06390 [Elusimicrobia bacterium]|nr:hypothetical protein [Elusimicrobiota bacterium]
MTGLRVVLLGGALVFTGFLAAASLVRAAEPAPSEAEAAREKLREMTLDLLKSRLKEGSSALERVEQFEEGLSGAVGRAELAKAVYDYAVVVRKIDSDLRDIEGIVNGLPDEDQRNEYIRTYMLANPGGHLVNYNDVVKIVFGGAKVGVALAAEVGKSAVGGGTGELIGAAELGMEVLDYVGDKLDPAVVKKAVAERVVKDVRGKTVCLNDVQLSKLTDDAGKSVQEKYDNTVILHEGAEVWLTKEMRERLDNFAMKQGLDPDMRWADVYARYRETKLGATDIDADKLVQEIIEEETRKLKGGLSEPGQPEVAADTACYAGAQQRFRSAMDWFPKLRDKGSFSKYSCQPMHSSQETPPAACCKTYYATRNEKGMWDEAWAVLQECGWKAEIESRRLAVEKAKAACLKAPAR